MNNDINNLRNELLQHKHFTKMANHAIQELSYRLRQRLINDMDSTPGDRSALLDADLVMAEAYKLIQANTENE